MTIFEQQQNEFSGRHIGPNEDEKNAMLSAIGVGTLEELIGKTIPDAIRIKTDLDVPAAISEFEYLSELKKVAAKNKIFKSYIGQGYYDTITPSVILRNGQRVGAHGDSRRLFQSPTAYLAPRAKSVRMRTR